MELGDDFSISSTKQTRGSTGRRQEGRCQLITRVPYAGKQQPKINKGSKLQNVSEIKCRLEITSLNSSYRPQAYSEKKYSQSPFLWFFNRTHSALPVVLKSDSSTVRR